MRNLKVVLAALALGVTSVALAEGAGPVSQTVTLTNDIVDTIAVAGTIGVNFSALNTVYTNTAATLAYSTHSDNFSGAVGNTAQTRKVTVSSTAIDGVTGTVSFTAGTGNGTGLADVALGSSAVNLVTGIPRYITQAAATLTYKFTASKGFATNPITVTYTLVDE